MSVNGEDEKEMCSESDENEEEPQENEPKQEEEKVADGNTEENISWKDLVRRNTWFNKRVTHHSLILNLNFNIIKYINRAL